MSEFEKEFNNCLHFGFIPNEQQNKIIEHFKDWQPPKPLVVVPQIVADWIKALKIKGIKPIMDSVTFGEIGFTEEKRDEILHWINEHQEEYMRAWLDGYTVEKEQLYCLKHIDLSDASKSNVDYFLCDIDGSLGHLWENKGLLPEGENAHFTQSEIDKLNIGSYEQIEVEP